MAKSPTNVPARRDNASSHAVTTFTEDLTALPDFMKADSASLGTEGLDAGDLQIPRVKLMQSTSLEIDTHDGLKKGDFWHTAAEFNLGQTFIGVPVFRSKSYILWRPMDSGGGILARADDGVRWVPGDATFDVVLDKKDGGTKQTWITKPTVEESGLAAWGTMNKDDPTSPPAATLMHNVVLVFPAHPELPPAILTFSRTQIGAAKKFMTTLKMRQRPIFAQAFEFSSIDASNAKGQAYKNLATRALGLVSDERLYTAYKGLYDEFSRSRVTIIDVESLQTEGVDSGDIEPDSSRPAY
jgi:hypothetical protein